MGMGEQKLRAKDSKQKTDELIDQESETTVVETTLLYECVRHPEDLPVAIGAKVRLVDLKNEILVFRGTQNIGYVAPGNDETLRTNVGLAHRKGRSVRAVVIEASDITPSFFARVEN